MIPHPKEPSSNLRGAEKQAFPAFAYSELFTRSLGGFPKLGGQRLAPWGLMETLAEEPGVWDSVGAIRRAGEGRGFGGGAEGPACEGSEEHVQLRRRLNLL